ncbi:hypothetical protein SAMN05421767_10844 [Granulicatella balaenopterae]|uniref:Cell shape-determining protein n=1 Tax=Granulicatella balaenopterae TaxID=137733 RepID=A0A1H9JBL0_9LACT|nr:EI24 domain-containing protein [Granulicatella balaenopterae]SEQ84173.1 hypothetical protein SAMN05421767_10844 [Granulicatella balaenopterae]
MKNFKKLIPLLITILVGVLMGYFWLIPINIHVAGFWMECLMLVAVYILADSMVATYDKFFAKVQVEEPTMFRKDGKKSKLNRSFMKKYQLFLVVIVAIMAILLVGTFSGLPIWQASSYASQIGELQTGNFEEDLDLSDASNIITVDRDMAEKLGSRKLGEAKDLVSQFDLSNDFVQISRDEHPLRVSPLEYASFWRWLKHQRVGIPYYVEVDAIDGSSRLVETKKPIRYSKSEYFNRDVRRHLWLHYPTAYIDEITFEVDEEGNPFYVATEVGAKIGLFSGIDVVGIYTVDAVTGEIEHYDMASIPDWVDRAIPARIILSQINAYGMYQSGFWNTIFSQQGVVKHSDGYRYFIKDNDLYLYTGLTSVLSDESNIGFVLVNSRTKEVFRYDLGAATESSAQESAEGSVQEKGYRATFPLLLNVEEKPTYFLSLKDSGNLVKLYAFVDAENYQRVVIGETVQEAYQSYTGREAASSAEDIENKDFQGTINQLTTVVLNGETNVVFTLTGEEDIYFAPVSLSSKLAFLQVGDSVNGVASGTVVLSIDVSGK